jgi:TolB protein
MKRTMPFLLVLGLLAALLASCGQPPPGQHSSIATATASPTQPASGPKGRIAWQGFLDPNQTTAAIFSANADGSNVRQLTQPSFKEQDSFPDWSPDGSKILFARIAANGPSDVWVMNADGTSLKQLTHYTFGAQWPRWSPDGSQILYSVTEGVLPDGNETHEALWIMNADGSHPVQFTHPPLTTGTADNSPVWSPDGKQILFVRHHPANGSYDQQALFLIKRDGTGLKQVTPWELEAGNEHWSPDGKRILFQSFGSFPDGTTPQLYTILPDGTHLVQLTSKERNSWPAWSPDGTQIIFAYRSSTERPECSPLCDERRWQRPAPDHPQPVLAAPARLEQRHLAVDAEEPSARRRLAAQPVRNVFETIVCYTTDKMSVLCSSPESEDEEQEQTHEAQH